VPRHALLEKVMKAENTAVRCPKIEKDHSLTKEEEGDFVKEQLDIHNINLECTDFEVDLPRIVAKWHMSEALVLVSKGQTYGEDLKGAMILTVAQVPDKTFY
jgi:hypothetical protein